LPNVQETELEGVVIEKNGRIIAICRILLISFLAAGLAGCGGPTASRSTQTIKTTMGLPCSGHMAAYDETLKAEAWALISEHSPEGAFMIREVEKTTKELCGKRSEHFASFINEGKKDINYYISIAMSIHEMAHNFSVWAAAGAAPQRQLRDGMVWVSEKNQYGTIAVYLTGKGIVYVPRTKTFPAKRMASRVPEDLRDHMYDGYIIADSHVSNGFGVYGYLDEFHAYYHDHQAGERMLRSELRFFEPTDYLGFLYFKYYILEYLDYAREHEKAIFKGIMANGIFVETFLDIHDRFEKLHLAHLEFRSRNITVEEGGRYKFGTASIVVPGLDKTYAALTRVLDQKKFESLMSQLRSRRGAGTG
jgi:hypothetical protein